MRSIHRLAEPSQRAPATVERQGLQSGVEQGHSRAGGRSGGGEGARGRGSRGGLPGWPPRLPPHLATLLSRRQPATVGRWAGLPVMLVAVKAPRLGGVGRAGCKRGCSGRRRPRLACHTRRPWARRLCGQRRSLDCHPCMAWRRVQYCRTLVHEGVGVRRRAETSRR